ncbi:MAG: aminotransferase class V-fold PLP-dependent enzyme [Pseudomonadota bacterium]
MNLDSNSSGYTTHIAADDEAYWAGVAAQYAVSPDFVNLENGYFGMQATPVFAAFQRHQARVNAENSYFLRECFASRLEDVMQALARFCGVQRNELLLTRNLIEGMNILLQGYPFNARDAVVCATHDYDSVVETLEMVQQHKQINLTRIRVPLDPDSDEQIVSLYEQAITTKTKVILLTHMVHRTGQIMPVAQIAAMARRHGVDVMVDAAHSFAQIDYQMPDLGADFVAVNLHKWLGAPLGLGMVYIRQPRITDIAPLYGDTRTAVDNIQKLAHVGTVPPAPILNIVDALEFHQHIGSHNKEARLRYLSQYWQNQVRGLPYVEILTPRDPARSCAIAAFRIDGMPSQQVAQRLMAEHKLFTVMREIDGRDGVRVTPHLFTRLQDLDLLVAAIRQISALGAA